MTEETFDEPRRWPGMFAVQGAGHELTGGELEYHPREGILLRTRNWAEPDLLGRDAGRVFPALQGVIEDGRPCTVLQAFETEVRGRRPEESRIVGNGVLLDSRCDDPSEPMFRRLRFRSPALTAVFRPHGIKAKPNYRRKRIRVDAAPLKPVSVAWGGNRLLLSSTVDTPGGQGQDGSFTLSEKVYLEARFAKAVSLEKIRRLVASLEFLTCLGEGRFGGPPDILLWTHPVSARRLDGGATAKPRLPGRLLLSQSWYRKPAPGYVPPPLFRLVALAPEPLTIVGRWLDLSERVERLMSLFRAATEAPDVETRFLFLIQSVEGLHRALDGGTGVDPGEFERVVDLLKEALPVDLSGDSKQFFANRLPRHNEPGLAGRLRTYGEHVARLVPGTLPKLSRDRRSIVELRDEFSHSLVRQDTRDPETHGRAVLYFCELLRMLFEFNLLRHLGVADDRLKSIFEENRRLAELARNRVGLIG